MDQPQARARKMGRTARMYNPRVPHLSAILAGKQLPPPPPSVNYATGMPSDLGVMMNDKLGDCTCAAFYHAIQVWSHGAKVKEVTEPDRAVEQLYIEACGYNPAKGGEGPGGNEQKVLEYLLTKGAPFGPTGESRHKILAFIEVDPRNIDDVKSTINDCGVAYIGFNVPESLMPPNGDPPALWTVDPSHSKTVGGHAVVLPGYDAAGAVVISWGQLYKMTWEFFSKFVDEVYGIADRDWVEKTGKTPAGMSVADLESQMEALKSVAAAAAAASGGPVATS
jgi:hypothetical protein